MTTTTPSLNPCSPSSSSTGNRLHDSARARFVSTPPSQYSAFPPSPPPHHLQLGGRKISPATRLPRSLGPIPTTLHGGLEQTRIETALEPSPPRSSTSPSSPTLPHTPPSSSRSSASPVSPSLLDPGLDAPSVSSTSSLTTPTHCGLEQTKIKTAPAARNIRSGPEEVE